jgi:phage replication initiation protein
MMHAVKTDWLTLAFKSPVLGRVNRDAQFLHKNGYLDSVSECFHALMTVPARAKDGVDWLKKHGFDSPAMLALKKKLDGEGHNVSCQIVNTLPRSELKAHRKQCEACTKSSHYGKEVRRQRREEAFASQRYAELAESIKGTVENFVYLLNSEVADDSDRIGNVPPFTLMYRTGMFNMYECSANLYRHGRLSAQIGYGPANGGFCVSWSGTGCDGVDMHRLHKLLTRFDMVRITRIDLAYDDLEGKRPIERYKGEYLSGGFNNSNKTPSYKWFESGEIVLDDGRITRNGHLSPKYKMSPSGGRTMQVGSRETQCCRVYEKGKQLGCEENPNWLRVEGEFRNKEKDLPLDMLINPSPYLAAMYPCLSFIAKEKKSVKIRAREQVASFTHLVEHTRISSGLVINTMLQMGWTDSEIVAELRRGAPDEFPKRLQRICIIEPNSGEVTPEEQHFKEIRESLHKQQMDPFFVGKRTLVVPGASAIIARTKKRYADFVKHEGRFAYRQNWHREISAQNKCTGPPIVGPMIDYFALHDTQLSQLS